MIRSWPAPAATVRPRPGLTATLSVTARSSWGIVAIRRPCVASHSPIVQSSLTETSVRPSDAKATPRTWSL